MGSCHRAELGQMKRRYWSLSVGLLLGLLLVAPHAAHAEGGTWPPVGQLAGGTPGDVAVQGDYAYVAAEAAFTVIDISDPAFPAQVGSWDTPGIAFGVAAAGAYAYVADAEEGLRVIDISDPAAPVEVGFWDTPGEAQGVAVAGGYVYLADCGWGLVIFPEYGNGGPQADFAASLASGEAPLTVEFTDLSTHSPTSWSWRFGDDGTSTAQHPSHTYTSEGTYTVSLTVSNAGGSDTVSVLSGLGTPVWRPV